MGQSDKYYLVKKKALPEVLLKVVEVNRMLETQKNMTIQEATDTIGISRSSFYKYKDDIVPFHEDIRGKTVTFMLQMDDIPGLLSHVLKHVANNKMNILTIHQSIPVNGVASITLSIEILPDSKDVTSMIDDIDGLQGVHSLKILARE